MHRIDSEGNVSNQFSAGNESVKGTVVSAEWLNDVQENIMAILSAAGITATKGRSADLLDSINKLISQGAGNDLADIDALRALTGTAATAAVIRVLDSDGSGNADYWFRDPVDESTPDDGSTVIVDVDGNRWRKQITGAWIPYATGETLESLKPAEGGADVTGNNTSANTLLVGSTPAATVESGSLVGNEISTHLSANNFVTSIADLVAQTEESVENVVFNGLNVNNWNSSWSPTDRSVAFNLRVNKATRTLTVRFSGHSGHTGASAIKLEIEVSGNTVASYSNLTANNILSNKGSNVDFAADNNVYGPNGFVWSEGLTNTADDQFNIVLTDTVTNLTSFRIRLVTFSTDDGSAKKYISFGDTPIISNPSIPIQLVVSPDDTSEHDVLLMQNAPADAGATNRKIFTRTSAPSNPGDDLHEGDLWFDTDDGNRQYHWNGSSWVEVRDSGAQAGSDLISNNGITIDPSSLGGVYGGDLVYSDDTSLEDLKPAEGGAQVFTGKSITELTDTTADNISTGSGSVQDIIDGLKLPSNGGFERGTAGSQEIPEAWFRSGFYSTSRTEYYSDSPSDTSFGSQLSYGAENATQNGGSVGWWRIGKKFQAGNTGDTLSISARVKPKTFNVPASISNTPGSTSYFTVSDAYIRIAFFEADGTLISTHNSNSLSQQVYDNGNISLPYNVTDTWIPDALTYSMTVPANTFRVDVWLVAVGSSDALSSLGLETGDGVVKFDDFTWSYTGEMREVSEATWASEPGATHGAEWGTNISGQPNDSDLLNSQQLWSDISGTGKPADNATNTKIFDQTSAPSNPGDDLHEGDIWFDTDDNNHLYRWNGSSWVSLRDGGIAQAINDAATALSSTAAGSLTAYKSPTEPIGRSDGDLWFDTSDGNKLYRYNFSTPQILSGNDRYFSSGIGNWSDTSAGAGGSASVDGVDEELDIVSDGVDYGQATISITTEAETEYELKFDVSGGGNDCSVRVGTTSGDNDVHNETFTTGNAKTERVYFTTGVGETTVYVSIRNDENQTISIDEVTVRKTGVWEATDDTRIADAITAAATAQSTADGKIETFFTTSTPTATAVGDLWWNTNTNIMSRWNGSIWETASIVGTSQLTDDAKLKTRIFAQDAEPTADSVGDIWFDTDDGNKTYRWGGASWVAVQDESITQALSDAAAAQSTADSKVELFKQDDEPLSGMSSGDIWIDTNDGNKIYTYDGADWTETSDSRIAQAINDAATAQSTADGKITAFLDESEPTAEGIGDLWFKPSTQVTRRWDGSTWELYSVTLTSKLTDDAGLKTHIFRQDTAPAEPGDTINNGDLWIDTDDDNHLYWWDGTQWTTARDEQIQAALDAASTAQSTADGKIEVFYGNTPPIGGVEGDLWFDEDDGNKQYRHNGSTWVEFADSRIGSLVSDLTTVQGTLDGKVSFFFGGSTPTAEAIGDLWYDEDDGRIRRWNGSEWIVVSTNSRPYLSDTEPSSPTYTLYAGDLWYDTDDGNKPYYWDGTQWVLIRDGGITEAFNAAVAAQSTADGKIAAFIQPAEPNSGMEEGDFWYDTDNGNRVYRYDGSDWVEVSDTRISQAISDAATAQATADGKIETFLTSNNTPPALPSEGDLWYDSGTELFKRWNGSSWETVSNSFSNTSQLVDDANLGQTALWASVTGADKPADNATNSKVLIGPTEPDTDLHEGDIWYDSSDGQKMHRYDGSDWIEVTDDGAAAGRDLLAALQAAGLNQSVADIVSTSNRAAETLPLTGVNINDWSEIYGGGGRRGIFLSFAIDRDPTSPTYKRCTIGLYGRNNHTGDGSVDLELEVYNNTIDTFSSNTFDGSITEKSGGLDFTESGNTFWGPNGLVTSQSMTDAVDDVAYFTLTNAPDQSTTFRLRVRELETTDTSGVAFVTLGDKPVVADVPTPFQFIFSPSDSTDLDVLIMANAPAQAGATNTKFFRQDDAPVNPGADLHDGDIWVDTNDGNKLYRWSGSDNGGTDEWQVVQDAGADAGRQLSQALVDQGLGQSIADIVGTANTAAEFTPVAGNNVNNWETEFSTSENAAIINIHFDKTNKRLYFTQKTVNGHTGLSELDVSVEIFGNLINSFTNVSKGTTISDNGGGIDFSTENEYGPNGFRWTENISGVSTEQAYFTLNETPSELTVFSIRVTNWTTADSNAKRILAFGDSAVIVNPNGTFKLLGTIADGTDLDVLIMKNAPASAGADVTAPRAAIKINYVDYSSSNSGEAYIHGFGSDGQPADVPAKILVGGSEVSLDQLAYRSIYTSQPSTAGYIILDSGLSNKFDVEFGGNTQARSVVFAKKENSTWFYDDNDSNWTSFTPTSTDVVIGTLVTTSGDIIASADIWAYPMSLDVISEAGATNSKNFISTTAPANNTTNNLHIGDIWIDSDDGNKQYRWDGSSWVNVQDAGATAGSDLITALENANLGQDIVSFVTSSNLAAETPPIGSVNVVRWWESPFVGSDEGTLLRVRVNKSTKQVEILHSGLTGHTGTAVADIEFKVSGNTISSIDQNNAEDIITSIPAGIDFNTEDQWGPNGVRWKESVTAIESDSIILTLTNAIGAGTIFTLRVREHSVGSGSSFLAMGSELILTDYITPTQFVFNTTDSTDQDVLVMQNAPAQAGATNTKILKQDDAPVQATDGNGNRYLHDGDLWFDTDDGNIVRRWDDPDDDGNGVWQLVRDEGAVIGSELESNLSNIGRNIADLVDVTKAEAAINVADWSGTFTPNGDGHKFHIRVLKNSKEVRISWAGVGSTSASKTIRGEFEVIGNTISSFNSNTFDSSYPDNGTVTFPWSETEYGTNGVNFEETTSSGEDLCIITLTDAIDENTQFRLAIISVDDPEANEHNYLVFGDTPFIRDINAPIQTVLYTSDSTDYDVLAMKNAPAEAGATNSKNFVQDDAPTNPADDIHIGDLWIDTDNGNQISRWDGSQWTLYRDAGAQAGSDLLSQIDTLGIDNSLAEFVTNITDSSKKIDYSVENVNDWSSYYSMTSRASVLRTRATKNNGNLFVSLAGTGGHTGTTTVKGEIEIFGDSISDVNSVTLTDTDNGGNIDFSTASPAVGNVVWGPNGLLFTIEITNVTDDEFVIELNSSSITEDIKFALRIREFTDTDTDAVSALSFGDRTTIIENPDRPFNVTFGVIDSSDYDVLVMQNAPAEAGADVTGNNTSQDTENVGGTPALDVAQGSGNSFAHDFETLELTLWSTTGFTVTASTGDKYSGTQSAKISTNGADPISATEPKLIISDSFSSQFSEEKVKVSFWEKQVSGEEPNGQTRVRLLTNSSIDTVGSISFTPSASWTKRTFTGTFPVWSGGETDIRIYPDLGAINGDTTSVLIDRISIETVAKESDLTATLLNGAGALIQQTVISKAQSSATLSIFNGSDPGVWKTVGASVDINCTGDDPVSIEGNLDFNITQINDNSGFTNQLFRSTDGSWSGGSGWSYSGNYGGVWYGNASTNPLYLTIGGLNTSHTYAIIIDFISYNTSTFSSCTVSASNFVFSPGSPDQQSASHTSSSTSLTKTMTFVGRPTSSSVVLTFQANTYYGFIEKVRVVRSYAGSFGAPLSAPQGGPGGPKLKWRMTRNGTPIYESSLMQVSGAGQVVSPLVTVLDETPPAGTNTYAVDMWWEKATYSGGTILEYDVGWDETSVIVGSGTQWTSNIAPGWSMNGWNGIVASVISDTMLIYDAQGASGEGGSFSYTMTAETNALAITKTSHSLTAIEYRNGG